MCNEYELKIIVIDKMRSLPFYFIFFSGPFEGAFTGIFVLFEGTYGAVP